MLNSVAGEPEVRVHDSATGIITKPGAKDAATVRYHRAEVPESFRNLGVGSVLVGYSPPRPLIPGSKNIVGWSNSFQGS